ncbi:hypothetical protein DM860_013732 [Cuscuta australis]|uniref:Uncharacterized protein n=1 Tax=Cuscuta australis TaxID=267555 RepID=A0A328ECF0_9ASTE|nr:hypothetical protein DM860_013732 [Cuscuta australis]
MERRPNKNRREELVHSSTSAGPSKTHKLSLFYDVKPAFRIEYTYPVAFYLLNGHIKPENRIHERHHQRLTTHNVYCERTASWEGKVSFEKPTKSELRFVWPSLSNTRDQGFPKKQLRKHSRRGGLTDNGCLGLAVNQYNQLGLKTLIERLDGTEAPRPEYLRKKPRVLGCKAEDYVYLRTR